MIYIVLPDFYDNYLINAFILEKILTNKNKQLTKTNITFSYVSGSFPFSLWAGGYNSNHCEGNLPLYDTLGNFYKRYPIPLRINCCNTDLLQTDYFDERMNIILSLNENGSNVIEICNMELMTYIKQMYPTYKFIFSENAIYLQDIDLDMLNQILSFDEFLLVKLPVKYNYDLDFLKAIENKNKVEIILNPFCPKTCENCLDCYIKEDISQITYYNAGPIENCYQNNINKTTLSTAISIQEIEEIYRPLGFTHFSFNPILNDSKTKVAFELFHYLFKEEYVPEFIEEFMLMGGPNG